MNEKKLWISSEFEIIELHTQDVITESPTTPTPGGDRYEGEIDWS